MPVIALLYKKSKKEQFMPRPVKCRKVCHFPNVLEFFPTGDYEKKTPIVLTVDEYETIRLLDKKGYSQEQCAVSMQIARTTVQRIYEIARNKLHIRVISLSHFDILYTSCIYYIWYRIWCQYFCCMLPNHSIMNTILI